MKLDLSNKLEKDIFKVPKNIQVKLYETLDELEKANSLAELKLKLKKLTIYQN